MWRDLKHALRTLGRERGFAAVVVLSLAVGVGANTAIFSIVNGVLLRPLPLPEPERLAAIYELVPKFAQMYPKLPVNLSHWNEWQHRSKTLERVALMRPITLNLTGGGEPELLDGITMSSNTFDVLGVRPQLGRTFLPEEEREGHDHVVILADSLWKRRFHGDPGIVGKTILLDGSAYLVVGVMPRGPWFPHQRGFGMSPVAEKAEVYKPLGYKNEDLKLDMGEFNYYVIARLKPGVSVTQATSELNVIQANITAAVSEKLEIRAVVTPLLEDVVGGSRRGLLVVMAAVGTVLLVLCVNLANLSFARAAGRRREFAIRSALGAGRGLLLRQMLTESVALALTGGALGVAFAYWILNVLLRAAPLDLPRVSEVQVDGRVLLFALGISVIAGLAFGVLPAFRTARLQPQDTLRAASHTLTEGARGMRLRRVLVGAEVGLSAVLLITAGLLIESFVRLMNVDRGFDVERVLAVDVALPSTKYATSSQQSEFFRRLLDKTGTLPGVVDYGIVSALPLQGETWVDVVGTEHDQRPVFERPTANIRFISPGYFKTLRVPLREGRTFDDSDRGRNVVIISQAVADRLWPGQDPVGRKMLHNDQPVEVVGVTPDIRSTSLDKDPVLMVYIPYWQRPRLEASLLVRTAMDPKAIAQGIRKVISETDPEVPVPQMKTMAEVMSDSVAQRRFQMTLVVVFAVAALALASFGVYGVLAYSVERRRNELGIRMALGAGSSELRRMVLRQGMEPVLLGLVAGGIAALAVGRVLSSLLFRVNAHDPLTLAAVAVVLCAVSGAACLLPAIRATRVDPVTALRAE